MTGFARRDEARHVAFGVAHLHRLGALDPGLRAGAARPSNAARRPAGHQGRRRRLVRIGFPDDEATELSRLHTRNFR
ncbi:hypothetical protein [Amycolatopsis sp. NPDC051371]|uniref:hypothetical protein n=1 Tax=Amycolatopsis sp. NPDC051371 TaxID=3155800 RepID=UPI003413DC74